jgi:transcriptional regulator with XRE-family HTH domain
LRIDVRRAFANRVRYLRREKRWTQEHLGERAGLTGKYIGQLERAEVCPSLRVVDQIARALDLPLHELVRFAEPAGKSRELLLNELSIDEIKQVRSVLALLLRVLG